MKTSLPSRLAGVAFASVASHPALAHVTSAAEGAHWHAEDLWGLGAVAGLVAIAVWIHHRSR